MTEGLIVSLEQAIYAVINLLIFYSSTTFWTWVSVFIQDYHPQILLLFPIIHPCRALTPVFPPVAATCVCTSSVCWELPLNVRHGQAGVCGGWKPPGWRN